MKRFKSFLTAMIIFVVAFSVPLLAGCAKTFIVDISIVGGNANGGWVYHSSNTQSISAYGENPVADGEKFSVYVAPDEGYEIESIMVNGEAYSKSYNKLGSTINLIIEEDTSIVVSFVQSTYTFKLLASTYNASGTAHTGFVEYTGYTLSAKFNEVFTLSEFDPAELSALETKNYHAECIENNGVFFWENSQRKLVYVDIDQGFTVKDDSYYFRTWLTAEELDELIKPVYTVEVSDTTDYSEAEAGESPYGTIRVTGDADDIKGSKEYSYKQGKTCSIDIKANAGYVIDKVFVNGAEYSGFSAGARDLFLTVIVEGNMEYEITFKAATNNEAGNE